MIRSSDQLLRSGEAELFKGSIHLLLFGLTAMCLGYNAMAFAQRRQRHLATNALVYGSLAAFEMRQITRHLSTLLATEAP